MTSSKRMQQGETAYIRLRLIGRAWYGKSLYLYNKHILKYNLLVERIHRPMCEHFQPPEGHVKGRDYAMDLEPRNTFKTTCNCVGLVCWQLSVNPDNKMLIAGSTKEEAAKRLGAVRNKLQGNDLIKFFFIDLAKMSKKRTMWKQESIVVYGRTITDVEPSVDTMGRGQDKTGNHYNWIILDDIENDSTVNSDVELANTKKMFYDLNPCMMPSSIPSYMRAIGTHWDDDDLYCMLRGKGEEYKGKFKHFRNKIERAEDEDGNLLMPEILDAKLLQNERDTLTQYQFSCNYNNDPVPRMDSHFPPNETMWWYGQYFNRGTAKYIRVDKVVKEGDEGFKWMGEKEVQVKTYLLVDPALSEDKQASHSALVVAAKQMDENRIWVIDGYRVKSLDPFVIIKMIISLVTKYDPLAIGIEAIAYQRALASFYDSEARKQGIYTRVEPIGRDDRRSKDDRIMGLSSFWKANMLMLPALKLDDRKENPMKALKRELWRFRVGSKSPKDMADALARINDIDVGAAVKKDYTKRIREIEQQHNRDWFLR